MPKTKKIALMFSVARAEEAQILRGVSDYAAKRGTWTLDRNPELYTISLRALAGWSGHGVLAPLRPMPKCGRQRGWACRW